MRPPPPSNTLTSYDWAGKILGPQAELMREMPQRTNTRTGVHA
jgi:hypothetical protein